MARSYSRVLQNSLFATERLNMWKTAFDNHGVPRDGPPSYSYTITGFFRSHTTEEVVSSLATLRAHWIVAGFQVWEESELFVYLHKDFDAILTTYDTNLSVICQWASEHENYIKYGPMQQFQVTHMVCLLNALSFEMLRYMRALRTYLDGRR